MSLQISKIKYFTILLFFIKSLIKNTIFIISLLYFGVYRFFSFLVFHLLYEKEVED